MVDLVSSVCLVMLNPIFMGCSMLVSVETPTQVAGTQCPFAVTNYIASAWNVSKVVASCVWLTTRSCLEDGKSSECETMMKDGTVSKVVTSSRHDRLVLKALVAMTMPHKCGVMADENRALISRIIRVESIVPFDSRQLSRKMYSLAWTYCPQFEKSKIQMRVA